MSTDAMAVPAPEKELVGLHSPPDSNSALKDNDSDSELSDLEPDLEFNELLDVKPDYYSDGGVPVFRPSMDEFADFQRYMRAINSYGMRSGIVKVIPPPEWVAAQPRLDDAIKTVKVKEPIKQDIMGTSGTYRQANILHQRSYNLPQWRQLCEQSEHQPPAKRGERRLNQDKPTKSTIRSKAPSTPSNSGSKKKGIGRSLKGKIKFGTGEPREGTATPDRLPTPVSPTMRPEEDKEPVKQEPDEEEGTPSKPKGGRQPKAISVSSRRKYNRRETNAIDEEAFKGFKYELEGEDYSPERCEELERAYWKTLTYAPPLYGADMPGTLFDDRTTTWNLGRLENLLDVLGTKIPGVNTAYLYLGMWKATFAWHLEDVDLYSINYLHFGAPKQWYSISQGDARRFEAAMKTIWPTDAKACDQFLRHKTFLISPAHLLSNFNIKVNKVVHHPGEFVITFPYGYHSGYNLGYNCAEAVNFALDSWLEFGRVAKKCDCSQAQDSVWIDVHEIERKLRGEVTEYEETDEEDEDEEDEEETANLLTPLGSNGDLKMKAPHKKRKRPTNERGEKSHVKKIRVRIKAPTKEPCILCPNDIPSEPLLSTEDGQMAHRICALYIPETSIESGEKETVTDVKYINKARLELKCNYCRSKKGACFQCSQKKCTRAYHATCAAAAGVLVEQGEIPVFGEDGTEYKDWGIEFSCRFHRTKRDKKFDSDTLDDNERILKAAAELKVGEVCQMQYYKADIFAGAVVENRKSEHMVLVDVLPRGERVEVEYKWLLIPDPADYRLPKPSPNAKPMPKSYKDKESLNTSKRQADGIPRAEDPFVTGCTWAEFKCENIAPNPYQVKLDLTKESQLWFYLGKTSTEARAQFTEDPAKPRHNPKGHFLDTIPKPPPAPPRQSYVASYPASLSQNALNAMKVVASRSVQPINSIKTEKPYVYKPRNTGDVYRVDPQAYQQQQNFLQRSAPYAFGTDPRYQQPTQSGPVAQHPSKPSPVNTQPKVPINPAVATQASHRPTVPTKTTNPFSGRSQNSRPSPFAKYVYLQKEHNRSPLEYKSPYRPGGGFMNGYQGSLEKHLAATLFRNKSGSNAPVSSPNTSYANSPRPSYSPTQPTPTPPSHSNGFSSYGAFDPPMPQRQPLPLSYPTTAASPNTWERKSPPQLHQTARLDYNQKFQHQQPSQRSIASQPQGPVLQPPAMYDRQAAQLHPSYLSQAHQPLSQRYQQTPISQIGPASTQNRVSHQPYQTHSQSVSQYQQHESIMSQPVTQTSSLSRQHQQTLPTSQPAARIADSQSQYHSQQVRDGHATLCSHQQYGPSLEGQQLIQEQHLQPAAHNTQPRDFPDVPIDSTLLIEKMMKSLKKAAPNPSSTAGVNALRLP